MEPLSYQFVSGKIQDTEHQLTDFSNYGSLDFGEERGGVHVAAFLFHIELLASVVCGQR